MSDRRMAAYSATLDAQWTVTGACESLGRAEVNAYRAKVNGNVGEIAFTRSVLRSARRNLHRAVDVHEAAWAKEQAINDELERKAALRAKRKGCRIG